jgi:hypothetical protein
MKQEARGSNFAVHFRDICIRNFLSMTSLPITGLLFQTYFRITLYYTCFIRHIVAPVPLWKLRSFVETTQFKQFMRSYNVL